MFKVFIFQYLLKTIDFYLVAGIVENSSSSKNHNIGFFSIKQEIITYGFPHVSHRSFHPSKVI